MFRYYLNKVYLPSMNSILDKEEVRVLRRKALAPAAGKVLEIGFGSGLNAGHYPVAVQHWTAVDAHKFPPLYELSKGKVDRGVMSAENLGFRAAEFDTVVSTYTLCSVNNIEHSLKEIWRVLKPGGQFLFLEHGLSHDKKEARRQRLLTPVNKVVSLGCRLDRDMPALIQASGLRMDSVESIPGGWFACVYYLGRAVKPLN